MPRKLEGKIAVVTGGSAGIGLGTARRFAEEGARVFITGRRQSELDKAVAAIGSNATAIQGDASKLADIDRIYARVKELAGRIDGFRRVSPESVTQNATERGRGLEGG